MVPGTSTPAYTGWVTVTLISVGWATVTATAYDSSNTVLSTISVYNPSGPSNGLNNKDPITFSGVGPISKVDIRITTPYPGTGDYPASHAGDGFGIDDLSFDTLIIPINIDIKPGSDPHSINLDSKGTIPVAILSTADFDATTVDPGTVSLAGASVGLRGKGNRLMASTEDVNGDGLLDLVVHVETEYLALTVGETQATLEAYTYGGTPITGTDTVRIVPP